MGGDREGKDRNTNLNSEIFFSWHRRNESKEKAEWGGRRDGDILLRSTVPQTRRE